MMKMMRLNLVPLGLIFLAGCSSITTIATNSVSQTIKAPRIETVNKVIKLGLAGPVTGYGCSDAKHFLDLGSGFDFDSKADKAKAAAAYDALFGDLKDHPPVYHDKKFPFPNDLLLAPTYHYEIRDSFFDSELCAVAAGYRAKVISISDAESTTAELDASSVDQSVAISVKNLSGGQIQISEENFEVLKNLLRSSKSDE